MVLGAREFDFLRKYLTPHPFDSSFYLDPWPIVLDAIVYCQLLSESGMMTEECSVMALPGPVHAETSQLLTSAYF